MLPARVGEEGTQSWPHLHLHLGDTGAAQDKMREDPSPFLPHGTTALPAQQSALECQGEWAGPVTGLMQNHQVQLHKPTLPSHRALPQPPKSLSTAGAAQPCQREDGTTEAVGRQTVSLSMCQQCLGWDCQGPGKGMSLHS